MKMGRKQNENLAVWKSIATFFILLSFFALFFLSVHILTSKECSASSEYKTVITKLKDKNIFVHLSDNWEVNDYLCDEGVVFNNHQDSYYASTWEDAHISEGKCMIKLKRTK